MNKKRSTIASVQFGSYSTSSVNKISQSTQNVNSITSLNILCKIKK